MRQYLAGMYRKSSPIDKAWAITDIQEDKAQNYKINKPFHEQGTHTKVCTLLAGRFESVRQTVCDCL